MKNIIIKIPDNFYIYTLTNYQKQRIELIYNVVNDKELSLKECSFKYNISIPTVKKYRKLAKYYKNE